MQLFTHLKEKNSIMEYYYFLNGTQYGPMPVESVVSRIDRNTLVWRQGMENWLPAGSLPELAPFLAQQVQPPQMNNVKLRDFSKTTKVFSIFGVIFSSIMLLISIVFISDYFILNLFESLDTLFYKYLMNGRK